MAPRRISIVPHTHWDREWYEPFQTFRLRLVELIDKLLVLLESDPSYSRFLLDGQMAVIDDYLEVRPENEERIRRLAAAGRISMGPWYIRDKNRPFRPGCSYEVLLKQVRSGKIKGSTVIRGPTARQFWSVAAIE